MTNNKSIVKQTRVAVIMQWITEGFTIEEIKGMIKDKFVELPEKSIKKYINDAKKELKAEVFEKKEQIAEQFVNEMNYTWNKACKKEDLNAQIRLLELKARYVSQQDARASSKYSNSKLRNTSTQNLLKLADGMKKNG